MRRTAWASVLFSSALAMAFACGGASNSDANGRGAGTTDAAPADATGAGSDGGAETGPTCSADVGSDPKNCGTCGHDCLGAPCREAVCAPIVIAADQNQPSAIAVDATSVYFQSADDGLVRRVPKDGGTVELVNDPSEVQTLAKPYLLVDATHVYFTSMVSMQIRRVPKTATATPSEMVLSLLNIGPAFTMDDDNIYGESYTASGYDWVLSSALKDGGAPMDVVNVKAPGGLGVSLAVDGTSLFWTEMTNIANAYAGSVHAIAKTTSLASDAGASTLLADKQGRPGSLVVDGTHLYWANADTGTVKKIPKNGGAVTVLATDQFTPTSVAVDATSVYWLTLGDGRVMTCPLSGCGAAARALAVAQASPMRLALDDKAVYWTARTGGAVLKVAK